MVIFITVLLYCFNFLILMSQLAKVEKLAPELQAAGLLCCIIDHGHPYFEELSKHGISAVLHRPLNSQAETSFEPLQNEKLEKAEETVEKLEALPETAAFFGSSDSEAEIPKDGEKAIELPIGPIRGAAPKRSGRPPLPMPQKVASEARLEVEPEESEASSEAQEDSERKPGQSTAGRSRCILSESESSSEPSSDPAVTAQPRQRDQRSPLPRLRRKALRSPRDSKSGRSRSQKRLPSEKPLVPFPFSAKGQPRSKRRAEPPKHKELSHGEQFEPEERHWEHLRARSGRRREHEVKEDKQREQRERELREREQRERELREREERERELREREQRERELREREQRERELREREKRERELQQIREREKREKELQERREREKREKELQEQREREKRERELQQIREREKREKELQELREREKREKELQELREREKREKELQEQRERERREKEMKDQQEREQKARELQASQKDGDGRAEEAKIQTAADPKLPQIGRADRAATAFKEASRVAATRTVPTCSNPG